MMRVGDAALRLDEALFSTWDRIVAFVRRADLALGDATDRLAFFERALWRRHDPRALRIAIAATLAVTIGSLVVTQLLLHAASGQGR
jgi:hypothetical protein